MEQFAEFGQEMTSMPLSLAKNRVYQADEHAPSGCTDITPRCTDLKV
ncbi:MAG: hypothetical protein AB1391_01745 [Candidatus Micrarchaeota archaeon]